MTDDIQMARSYLNNTFKAHEHAREYLEKYDYDKSIRESQESIEFSIKAIFYAFDIDPPKSHNFTEENFKNLLEKITKMINPNGPKIRTIDFQKPYLYSKFWGMFYETAKYGLEKLQIGLGNLFEKEEAELAFKHSGFCSSIANVAVNVYATNIKKRNR